MNSKEILLYKLDSFRKFGFDTSKELDISCTEEEIKFELESLKHKRILKCYNHIAKYWSEDSYKNSLEAWKDLQQFILPENSTNGYKCCCGIIWSEEKFISRSQLICDGCDQYSQPYLSNPINKQYVLDYVHSKYHKYIFE